MIKLGFSSVACPGIPLRDVASLAESVSSQGVELRTFGSASRLFACDPAMSGPAKVARHFSDAGARIVCIATSCRFDEPVTPPVIGRLIRDVEKSVREAKFAIDLASAVGAPYVRVFGFEAAEGAGLDSTTRLVVERLVKVCDHARHKKVRIALENGGSYPTATQVAGVIDRVGSPLLGAEYNIAVAHQAGESAANGFNVLSDRLWCVKIKDFRGALPCAVGQGDLPCREAVTALNESGYDGWLIYEYDRAWLGEDTANSAGDSGDAASMIRDSFAAISRWSEPFISVRRAPRAVSAFSV